MLKFVDTHTHLYLNHYAQDRTEVIQRAIDAGVTRMILPNIDKQTIDQLYRTVDLFPDNLFPAMGFHANSVKQEYTEDLKFVEKQLEKRKFYAIGEIGIDLYRNKEFKQQQIEVFKIQLNWAKQLQLPVIIHIRESFDLVLDILQQENSPQLRGVVHCFVGTYEDAMKIRQLGDFYIGIGGILTFKNSDLAQHVRKIPMDMILLETDAPFLAPHPYRGKRNESSYIPLIAEKLAQVKGLTLEEIAKITTENALKLFNLP